MIRAMSQKIDLIGRAMLLGRLEETAKAVVSSDNSDEEKKELLVHVEIYRRFLSGGQNCNDQEMKDVITNIRAFCALCGQ